MKKFLLLSCLLMSTLVLKSQTFTSEQINIWKPSPNITIKNDEGKTLFSVPCHFKRNTMLKAKVKTLVVGDKKYLIKKEKKRIQKVYTGDWELVAIMDRHGESILFAENKKRFRLQKNGNWFRHLRRAYLNEKGEQVVYTTIKHRVYVINVTKEKNEQTDLLMALSLHQLMEAEARRKATDNIQLVYN